MSLPKFFEVAIYKPLLGNWFCGKFDKICQYPGIRFDDKWLENKNISDSYIKLSQPRILLHKLQIFSNSFEFCWVFKGCFDKHDCNFDNVSKIGYFRSPQNQGVLKQGLWRQNLCPWFHQKNFVTWLKLYCKCGHVTNSSISIREVIITSFFEGFDQKTIFWFKLNNLGLVLGMTLTFKGSATKGLKLKVRKF